MTLGKSLNLSGLSTFAKYVQWLSLRFLPAFMLRGSVSYENKGTFRKNSFVKNLIYITSEKCIAFKIVVMIPRESTRCQAAYTPSPNQLQSARSISFYRKKTDSKRYVICSRRTANKVPKAGSEPPLGWPHEPHCSITQFHPREGSYGPKHGETSGSGSQTEQSLGPALSQGVKEGAGLDTAPAQADLGLPASVCQSLVCI